MTTAQIPFMTDIVHMERGELHELREALREVAEYIQKDPAAAQKALLSMAETIDSTLERSIMAAATIDWGTEAWLLLLKMGETDGPERLHQIETVLRNAYERHP